MSDGPSKPTSADLEFEATRVTPPGQQGAFPLGTQIAGRYRLLEVLGTGGMGVVYRAWDEMLELELALKLLKPEIAHDPDFLKRFRNELVLARKVSHRHVVSNYDVGEHQGVYFMTMDLVRGQSLHEVLVEKKRLTQAEAVRVIRQVAAALEEAHRQGIVHRDLKPANILIDEAGEAYVSDFGIARSLEAGGMTRTGEIVGTPHYLSPEQARGEKVDGRSDLYALGIIFIQSLSGKVPSPGGTLLEIVAQRMSGRLQTLDELGVDASPELQALLARWLAKDVDARYQTAGELLRGLDELESPRPPVAAATPPPARRRRGGWKLRAVAVLLLLAVGGFAGLLEGWWPVPAWWPGQPAWWPEAPAWWPLQAWWPEVPVPPEEVPPEPVTIETPSPPVPMAMPAPEPRFAVAVLPFSGDGGSSSLAWAATGVAEMLATDLAEDQTLRVVDSVRVFQVLKDLGFEPGRLRAEELVQLAGLWGVDRLIVGGLRAVDDQIRLEMSLMEVDAPGSPVRRIAEERGELRQLFDLVDRLGVGLREALEVSPEEEPQMPMTLVAEAMRSYTEGLDYLSRRETLKAAPALEAAVVADPGFVNAWVRLSQSYRSLGRWDEALAAAKKAVEASIGMGGRIVFEAQAEEALVRGEPGEAQRFLRQLVERYPSDTSARIALAEAYGFEGRFADAVARLEEVIELDPGDPRAWYLLGRYSIQAGDSRRAVDEYLVQALVQQKKLKNEQGEGEVLNALGVGYERLGEMERAAESYELAAETRRRVGDQRGLATTLQNLAAIYATRGDYGAAEERLREALAIHTELGNQAGIATVYNSYGGLAEEQGENRRALDDYRRALQVRDGLGDEHALAESHVNVGFVYYNLGEYDNALLYLERGLALYEKNEDGRGIYFTLQVIGLCQMAQGKWPEAVTKFVQSLELSRKSDERQAIALSQGFLGQVALYQGRYPAALEALDKALAGVAEVGDVRSQVAFGLHRAEVFLDLGARAKVGPALDQAEALLAEGQNREQRSQLLTLRGELALASGDVETARGHFAAALEEAEAVEAKSAALRARLGAARAAVASGDLAAGRAALVEVSQEAERLGNAILQLRSAEALARVTLEIGDAGRAEDILRGALRLVETGGSYSGAWRLHLLLSDVLVEKSDPKAAEVRLRARDDLARIRDPLDADLRRSFDALPEVGRLTAARPAGP